MRLLSLSRSVIYNQIRAGRLRSVKEGSTRLIPADAIADYVALLKGSRGADDGRRAAQARHAVAPMKVDLPLPNGYAATSDPTGGGPKYVYGKTREIVHDKWVKLRDG